MGTWNKLTPYIWESEGHYAFWCPGCQRLHVYTEQWQFNGNIAQPTFTPSLRLLRVSRDGKDAGTACHLCLVGGVIQYQNDCPHALNGKHVAMVPIPEGI